jgi:hypothetical protein
MQQTNYISRFQQFVPCSKPITSVGSSNSFYAANPLHQSIPAIRSMQQTHYINRFQQFFPCSNPVTAVGSNNPFTDPFQQFVPRSKPFEQLVTAIRSDNLFWNSDLAS